MYVSKNYKLLGVFDMLQTDHFELRSAECLSSDFWGFFTAAGHQLSESININLVVKCFSL